MHALSPTEENATDGVVNHFNSAEAAARYAGNRPQSHGRVLALLRTHLGDEVPVGRALDVGCGTGHSTWALLPLARAVVGLDASRFMLAQAQPHPQIEYRSGYAEALPFGRGEFDLLAVCSAYHWFDQECFLQEAARVLRERGWMVLYKVGSTGRIVDCPEFEHWRREVLRARYPKTVRNDEFLSAEKAASFGLHSLRCERSTHVVRHTLADYVDNLLTHSSLIRAMERKEEPPQETREWLRRELAPFFVNGTAEFRHEDWFHLLRRESAADATRG